MPCSRDHTGRLGDLEEMHFLHLPLEGRVPQAGPSESQPGETAPHHFWSPGFSENGPRTDVQTWPITLFPVGSGGQHTTS